MLDTLAGTWDDLTMDVPFTHPNQQFSSREQYEAAFREMYLRGCTYQEIGDALGVTRQRAEQLRKLYKVPRRPWTPKPVYATRSPRESTKEHRRGWLYAGAKTRASQLGLGFNLTLEDIELPDRCPVFGFLLNYGNTKLESDSPTLDRRDPKLGYIKGNVVTISWKANRLKSNGTLDDFIAIVKWLAGDLWVE